MVIIYYCYLFVEVVPFVTTQDTKKQLGQVLDKMVNKKNVSWIVMTNRYFEDGTREEDGKSVLFKGIPQPYIVHGLPDCWKCSKWSTE